MESDGTVWLTLTKKLVSTLDTCGRERERDRLQLSFATRNVHVEQTQQYSVNLANTNLEKKKKTR